MAGWKTYSLSDVIGDISNQTFVLPVVQRRLVWAADKMELLFDSLLKGDAFGGIMVIEEQEADVPLFEYRPFSLHGETLVSSPNASKLAKRTYFVIDGQQRLQSFYMGLLGLFEGSRLFFDLFGDWLRGYVATRILMQHGLGSVRNLKGGYRVANLYASSVAKSS